MENLRWVLIAAGVAILILLYMSGRPKRPANRTVRDDGMDFDPIDTAGFNGRSAEGGDPLLGGQGGNDQYNSFDGVDPDDLVRPGSVMPPSDYGFEDGQTTDANNAASSGLGSLSQKFEAFSERLTPKRRQRVAASEPEQDDQAAADPEYASKIVTLHVVAQQNSVLPGEQLLQLFENRGYHYGDMNIFHSMHNGNTVFSIAKMIEPGFFDIQDPGSFETPGITLILQLPGPVAADVAFEVLVSEAHDMAAELGASVLDEQHSTLTKQTVQHLREGIYEYMHRQKYFGSVPS